jgi:hypothetical protein
MTQTIPLNLLVKGVASPRWVPLGSLDPSTATLVQLRSLLVSKKIMGSTDTFMVDDAEVDAEDLGAWTILAATKSEGDGKRSIQVKPAAGGTTSTGSGTTGTGTGTSTDTGGGTDTGGTDGTDGTDGTGTSTGGDDSPVKEDDGDPDQPAPGPLTPPTRPSVPSVVLPSVADETVRLQYYNDLTRKQKRWVFAKVGMYRGLRFLLSNQNLASPGTDVVVVPRSGTTWPNGVPTSPTLSISASVAFTWTYHLFQKDVSHSASLGGSYKMVGLSAKYQRDESHLEIREKTKTYIYGEYLLPKISLVLDKDDLVMPPAVVDKFRAILRRSMQAARYFELVRLLNDQIGAYVPLEIIVGGRLWSERTTDVTSNDDLDRKVDAFGTKLSVQAKAFSINAGYNYRNEQNRTDSSTTSNDSLQLNLVGGDPAKFPEPPKWIGSLGPYKSWAPVKYAALEPTIAFLPGDVRDGFLEVVDRFAPYDPGDELVNYRAYIRDFMVPDDDLR